MVQYRDPIHGDLSFEGVLEELILTEEFQRLSEVKQLGLTDKVYPGANHTRFSHALGACFLAGQIASRLNVPEHDKKLIQIAALLHDIGHFDFSHALEKITPIDHEENGKRIILGTVKLPNRVVGQIAEVLCKYQISPLDIVNLLHKDGSYPTYYYEILSSPVIDCDRMDYLLRDTYYTGAVIGVIDVKRLLGVLIVHPQTGQLAILEKGIASLEQFLVARMHMYQQVYMHPDCATGETMLRKAAQSSYNIAMPLLYGDGQLIARLSEQGTELSKELIRAIRAGKRAYHQPVFIIDRTGTAKHLVHSAEILQTRDPQWTENKLLEMTNLNDGDVLVSFPASHRKAKAPPVFPVLLREGAWSVFFEISAIAKTAANQHASRTVFVVYTRPQYANIVKDAATKLLSEILL